jgi:hypothetical protein
VILFRRAAGPNLKKFGAGRAPLASARCILKKFGAGRAPLAWPGACGTPSEPLGLACGIVCLSAILLGLIVILFRRAAGPNFKKFGAGRAPLASARCMRHAIGTAGNLETLCSVMQLGRRRKKTPAAGGPENRSVLFVLSGPRLWYCLFVSNPYRIDCGIVFSRG